MEYVTYKSPAGNREHLNFRQTKANFAQPNNYCVESDQFDAAEQYYKGFEERQ